MRTIVITGASDGIGAAAARLLAAQHPEDRLVLVGRNPQKTAAIAESVGADFFCADYSSLADVRRLAHELLAACDRIDVLANNAGGIFDGPIVTEDGFEQTFQINYLAPFLLTHELFPLLEKSKARVVMTSSLANVLFGRLDFDDLMRLKDYKTNRAYGTSKLADLLFARSLHHKFHHRGISTVAFHPGVVLTNFAQDSHGFLSRFYKNPLASKLSISAEQGGKNLAYFIDGTPTITWQSGVYYSDKLRPGLVNPLARSQKAADTLFTRTESMLGIHFGQPIANS
ncbi:SDR family NAD(P)-dependent oxidoreductase [Corynebacterium pseudotuberculosis]|uniref:SDR family NAD(P)-dependent oxidoreductase n=1 Tax=Corynebacterium pseudotuberculosis TaxID=1719 RepID=UPI0002660E95|nr:SDR family NAD(P)-dependent oxidoreductase [Corynebacterium pseudotuberculosis]AFM07054.1 SDR family NAD(P)-dependent oxidoreductase [Corynebacterium pseudotuberculosis Cp162]APG82061.1 short-chain dehydrogenase [Corynebacterium pseudotuberculosis]WFP67846.1 SDR family NAD(P)-dependent oxidoreductase [Corynebacterium pseudotuberculosis]